MRYPAEGRRAAAGGPPCHPPATGIAMLHDLADLRGYAIAATDGRLGSLHDLFFEDRDWTVRYLVVDTAWLFGRRVLLAPEAVARIRADAGAIEVDMTCREIEKAPDIGVDLPVSRQKEELLRLHHRWPLYWQAYPGTPVAAPLAPGALPPATAGVHEAPAGTLPPGAGVQPPESSEARTIEAQGDPHLRSAKEVTGYRIDADDGEIGSVGTFLVDPADWRVVNIVVDTGNWLPGRRVLIEPGQAKWVDWGSGLVRIALDRETIRNAPAYDPDRLTAGA